MSHRTARRDRSGPVIAMLLFAKMYPRWPQYRPLKARFAHEASNDPNPRRFADLATARWLRSSGPTCGLAAVWIWSTSSPLAALQIRSIALELELMIRTKSVHSPIDAKTDGLGVLVTRFRGRGLPKGRCDVWMPNLAPSEKLLRDGQGGRLSWAEFSRRYRAELFEAGEVDRRNRTIWIRELARRYADIVRHPRNQLNPQPKESVS
jgi:uncharacterized protein YeaO (DUF488 family)